MNKDKQKVSISFSQLKRLVQESENDNLTITATIGQLKRLIEENKDENSSAIGPFEINLSLDETINVKQFYESSISAKQK